MEDDTDRYNVFLGWKNQYCQKVLLPKAVYNFNAYPDTNDIFHRTRKQILKVCMVEREVGGGIGMGNTCISKADSCQCMPKPTTIL